MKPPPLHVLAKDYKTAVSFVQQTLKDDIRRLHFITDPEQLYGRWDWVLYVHPSVAERKDYALFLHVITEEGLSVLVFDNQYARKRFAERVRNLPAFKGLPT